MSPARVVVVGDALLDRDVEGSVERICPDAPAPVVDEMATRDRAGGAALAADLVARDGAEVTLVTALADDAAGERLRTLITDAGADIVDLRLTDATPEKVRVRADGQCLLRLDRGGPPGVEARDATVAVDAIAQADVVLVADYGRGVAAVGEVRHALARTAAPCVWDPHPRGSRPVPGTTVATPNRRELATLAAGIDDDDLATIATEARHLAATWEVGALAVTMGRRGVLLTRVDGPPLVVPVDAVHGCDTCGAGDSFAAATAMALARGAVLPEAVEHAARASAAFVASGGAAALRSGRSAGVAAPGGSASHRTGRVVATGGCFDLLHAGHVALLEAAGALGDRLVVLLNSDRSVARLKGPGRPLQREQDRRALLLALGCVDEVVVFDEDTPVRALEQIRPDVWVKGGDYAGCDLPEAPILDLWGGQAVVVPYLADRSTTRIVEEVRRGG